MGEISKKTFRKEVDVVWTCDAKRGALRKEGATPEGDGNESRPTMEMDERKT